MQLSDLGWIAVGAGVTGLGFYYLQNTKDKSEPGLSCLLILHTVSHWCGFPRIYTQHKLFQSFCLFGGTQQLGNAVLA